MKRNSNQKTLSFSVTPNIKDIYESYIVLGDNEFKEKRYFELLISQAVSNCDYKRLRLYIVKAHSDKPSSSFNNLILVYHTIAMITLLCRLAIIEGVSEKESYSLSDAYLTLDFQKLTIKPLELIFEIADNFLRLIENAKYYKYDSLVVTKTINYIHNNIATKFSLTDLAEYNDVTPKYLSSHFKKVTSTSIKDFINNEKIEHSKLLLISTDLSLLDIALELGYSDQSYFSKIFKRYANETPLQFKRKGVIMLQKQKLDEYK